ncbi:hypothetical protein CR513_23841, partial [Mucuna pruriens]
MEERRRPQVAISVVANLQEKSEEQACLTEEEVEKHYEEELKLAAEQEARLREQLESLRGAEGHSDKPPPCLTGPTRALTRFLDPGLHQQWKQSTKLQVILGYVEGGADEMVLKPSTTLYNIVCGPGSRL